MIKILTEMNVNKCHSKGQSIIANKIKKNFELFLQMRIQMLDYSIKCLTSFFLKNMMFSYCICIVSTFSGNKSFLFTYL